MEEACVKNGYEWRPINWSFRNSLDMFAGYRNLPCTLTATTPSGNCAMPTKETVENVADDIFWMLQCEHGTTAWGGPLPDWLSTCEYFGYELVYEEEDGPMVTKAIEVWDNSTVVHDYTILSTDDSGGLYYHCLVTRPQNWIGWENVTKELQNGDQRTFHMDQIPEDITQCEYLRFLVDFEVLPPAHP